MTPSHVHLHLSRIHVASPGSFDKSPSRVGDSSSSSLCRQPVCPYIFTLFLSILNVHRIELCLLSENNPSVYVIFNYLVLHMSLLIDCLYKLYCFLYIKPPYSPKHILSVLDNFFRFTILTGPVVFPRFLFGLGLDSKDNGVDRYFPIGSGVEGKVRRQGGFKEEDYDKQYDSGGAV